MPIRSGKGAIRLHQHRAVPLRSFCRRQWARCLSSGSKHRSLYPFGAERTGYLVSDLDAAVSAAKSTRADVLVDSFPDPIGRDAVIQWPGGVNTLLYWHFKTPSYQPFQMVPENRVYSSSVRVAEFLRSFLAFSHGKVVSDDPHAPGVEIGRPSHTFRRIRVESLFGKLTVLMTDGHLPYPYGRELTGYEVVSLPDTLARAKPLGVCIIVQPYSSDCRSAAMVEFPGGYIAEIHDISNQPKQFDYLLYVSFYNLAIRNVN